MFLITEGVLLLSQWRAGDDQYGVFLPNVEFSGGEELGDTYTLGLICPPNWTFSSRTSLELMMEYQEWTVEGWKSRSLGDPR